MNNHLILTSYNVIHEYNEALCDKEKEKEREGKRDKKRGGRVGSKRGMGGEKGGEEGGERREGGKGGERGRESDGEKEEREKNQCFPPVQSMEIACAKLECCHVLISNSQKIAKYRSTEKKKNPWVLAGAT